MRSTPWYRIVGARTRTDPLPAVSAEALAAATVGPAPLTDAAVIAQLRQQLEARGGTILRLQAEIRTLSAPPPAPKPFHGCPGCAGHRQVIADLREEMRGLRRRFMELHLAAPGERERTWTPPPAEVP